MPSFSVVLTSCIAKAVLTRRRNIIDWTNVKDLLADELRFEDREINISLVSHNNFQPRLRQRGFDGDLDLAVLILDVGSTFTDRVCEGLHRQRSRPNWPLLILKEMPSGQYKGERLILGPTNSASLKKRAQVAWSGIAVSPYESVWK
jgi:hypothetical protein